MAGVKADATIFALRALILASLIAVAWLMCGCINIVERTQKPYFVAPGPYDCTARVARAIGAPFRKSSHDPIGDAFVTLTWPIWLVDLPCEAVFDTVFLPVDAAFGKK